MKHIKGLDSLRFIAAALVLLMHSYGFFKRNIDSTIHEFSIFTKGHTSVFFFFTLSGFLITLLLIKEIQSTKDISLKKFYLKRIFRIWPLYILISIFGLLFYNHVLPLVFGNEELKLDTNNFGFYYSLFLSNYYNSFWSVGGILMVTWSISIEEQFYLFWAPLMKYFKKNIKLVMVIVFFVFFLLSLYNYHFVINSKLRYFLFTLQFHNMSIGAIFAYLYLSRENIILKKIINNQFTFYVCSIAILVMLLFFTIDHFNPYMNLVSAILYGQIIYSYSIAKAEYFIIKNFFTEKLGLISFGIYMYHAIVIYVIGFTFNKLDIINYTGCSIGFLLFSFLVLLLTIFISFVSYFLFEKRLIKFGRNVFIKA